jgi:hypothetical protein
MAKTCVSGLLRAEIGSTSHEYCLPYPHCSSALNSTVKVTNEPAKNVEVRRFHYTVSNCSFELYPSNKYYGSMKLSFGSRLLPSSDKKEGGQKNKPTC